MPAFAFDEAAAADGFDREIGRLITNISKETRAAIRAIIGRSLNADPPLTPIQAARLIQRVIGLNAPQAEAVANFRAEQAAMGQTPARVNLLVSRLSRIKVRLRAKTIARTEVMAALNRGSRESWRQAQREGLLRRNVEKTWIITPDERLCAICAPLDEVSVPLNDSFETSVGPLPGPPAHPSCRCTHSIER